MYLSKRRRLDFLEPARVLRGGLSGFAQYNERALHAVVRHGVALDRRVGRAEDGQCVRRRSQLVRAVVRLHGEKRAADLDHWQRQLAQHPQVGDRAGDRAAERRAMLLGLVLRTGVDSRDVGKTQCVDDLIQKINALAQCVEQDELGLRT